MVLCGVEVAKRTNCYRVPTLRAYGMTMMFSRKRPPVFCFQIGMSLVIHVGDDEDLPETPENFPKCYDWPRSDFQDKPSNAADTVSSAFLLFATVMWAYGCIN